MKKINLSKYFKENTLNSYAFYQKRKYSYVYINGKLIAKYKNNEIPKFTIGKAR